MQDTSPGSPCWHCLPGFTAAIDDFQSKIADTPGDYKPLVTLMGYCLSGGHVLLDTLRC